MIRRIIKIFLFVVFILIISAGAFLIYASITTYHPDDIEELKMEGKSSKTITTDESYKIVTWNIGYGGLGDNEDCYFDGGKGVIASSKERVEENLNDISNKINQMNPDLIFLQEVDIKSDRSYKIDEQKVFDEKFGLNIFMESFACNYKAGFVPYPFPKMLGKVEAGLLSYSKFDVSSSTRIQLPIPFGWPSSMFNLKRCLLVDRIKINDKELVLVNLHLEAYDDGEGRKEQTEILKDFINKEYEKGNYVLVGGDFNQTFSNINYDKYPNYQNTWKQEIIDAREFKDWNLLMDTNYPTCRSLDKIYKDSDKTKFQFYMIDGFIVSKNIEVITINTVNLNFVSSDHNPVVMNFKLVA